MELQPMKLFVIVALALVASPAALTSKVYWNNALSMSDTPMPKTTKDLSSEWLKDKRTLDEEGGTKKQKHGCPSSSAKGPSVNDGISERNFGQGKGNLVVAAGPKKRLEYVEDKTEFSRQFYYAANGDQLQHDPNVVLFFLENDLHSGSSMNFQFVKRTTPATLLPQKVSESIPFSSKYIPEIYKKFSIKHNSREAEIIQKIIKVCEEPGIKGEEKCCATSLESMIDFSISKLGENVHAIPTETVKETQMQKYTIAGVKKATSDKAVVCHTLNYVYAVFYCHKTESTEAFEVSLVGADGTEAKSLVICHKDTSKWNPKHLAFQVLKVKPGTVPVCHFLPEDHIVWVSN